MKNETCHTCGKIGHISRVCLSKNVSNKHNIHYTEDSTSIDESNMHEIHMLSEGKRNDNFHLDITVEGKVVTFELDTGASLTSISYEDYKTLFSNKRLFKTGVELRTYTGEVIKPRGVIFVQCDYKGQTFVGKLYIINQRVDRIFGREWIREIKLDWAEIKSISMKETKGTKLDALLLHYEDLFDRNIGCIPSYEAKLNLKENTNPIYIKPRQVPYAIRSKLEKELCRLEEQNIITKVDNSEWGTPIVPVIKPNGDIRICADFKVTLNKVIKDEHYPIPRIEDIFSSMSGGKYFCTLDISNAYLHMGMNEESSKLQTLSTHKGMFKVNRLMFGVKVAPSLWQKFMDSILQGLDGVQCFFDDIVIQGSTFEETLLRLEKVFKILKNHNLHLNREKCKFFEKSIKYLGHIIDEKGLHKSPEKTEAIRNARRPTNVSELKTFLGLAAYYNKFIPEYSTIVHPLTKLLRKNVKFVWSTDCERSFAQVKEEITSDRTLAHFDPTLTVILATDASPVGLGAVISHRLEDGTEKPIAFASRTLTQSESKYSQIDKEAAAIYFGLKKFFPYIYGRKFVLVTDHKPLVSIFNPHKTLPTMAATRIFNYAHFLSGFDYTIEFRRTEKHSNADFLSRFPHEKSTQNTVDEFTVYQINQLETLPVTTKQIAAESQKEDKLKSIIHYLETGQSLERLGYKDYEFTLQDGCIFKGNRVVIPQSLKQKVLAELHVGHLGIVKMKGLARSYCHWQGIDQDIENLVKTCKQCCIKQNKPPLASPHPWQIPDGPWQRLHIDFAGPCFGNNYFFIVVDAYTKWVEVYQTKTITSDWCVTKMRELFSTFGIPYTVVSDNGRQFTGHIFKTFLENYSVTHKTIAPFHPNSNGLAERFVQTVKKGLLAMKEEKGDLNVKLQLFLMQLRRSKNPTGLDAYSLMFGREIRTRLDLMKKSLSPEKICSTEPRRKFQVGERVQVCNFREREGKWSFGNIMGKEGNLIYIIKMDDGCTWRHHVDHILPSKFEGED